MLKGQIKKIKKAKGTSYHFGCQTPTDKIEACHHLYYRMYEYRNYIIRTTFNKLKGQDKKSQRDKIKKVKGQD